MSYSDRKERIHIWASAESLDDLMLEERRQFPKKRKKYSIQWALDLLNIKKMEQIPMNFPKEKKE